MSSQATTPSTPAAWAAAKAIANDLPNMKSRKAGPSSFLAWCGIVLAAFGVCVTVLTGALISTQLGPWSVLLTYLGLGLSAGGVLLLLWTAPRSYILVITQVVRRTETVARRGALALSGVASAGVLILVIAAHFAAWPGSSYIPVLLLAIVSTAVAWQALSLGAAVVSASNSARGYNGRRWALLLIAFGVCMVGATIGALAARVLGEGAVGVWPSVTLAVFGVVVGIFAQQHRESNEAIDALDRALANLHNELTSVPADASKVRASATDLESAMIIRNRGPFAIAPLPLVDDELRICLYYLMSIETDLPFRVTSEREAQELGKLLDRHDSRILLAELCWEVRRRLLRPAKTVNLLDERAFDLVAYPTIPAPQSHRAGTTVDPSGAV